MHDPCGPRNRTNILVLCVNVKNVIPQKSGNVRSHSSNSIENATPLWSIQSRKCHPIPRETRLIRPNRRACLLIRSNPPGTYGELTIGAEFFTEVCTGHLW